MFTATAALSLDDIALLLEGLSAAASAHRGPKTALALKKEGKRAQLVTELETLQAGIIEEMVGKPAAPTEKPAAPKAAKKPAAAPAATTP